MTFERFLDERLPQLMRLATVLCGDRALAEDVLQDVLLRAHQLWPRISAVDAPFAYVRAMLVNEHLAWRRKWGRQVPTAEVETGLREPDPAGRLADRDDLRQRLDTLPAQQRAAVVLRYFADLSDGEIAEALGCGPVTVRSYISRGLATMRVQLTTELVGCKPSRKDELA